MMNDRFDAQLREHLLGTADTKPAAGQLDGVLQAVSGTAQTHPVVARLTTFSGRAGSGPAQAFRYALIAGAVIVVIAAAAILGGGQNATPPPATATVEPTAAPTVAPTEAAPTAPEPTVAADPNCIQFDGEGTYTQNAGTLPVTVTVPGLLNEPWSGDRDSFALRKASCGGVGLPLFHAALVAHAPTDACHWKDSIIEAPTAFDLVQQLGEQRGHDTVGPIDTHLGGFRATRYDFAVPAGFDTSPCDRGTDGIAYLTLFGDQIILPGHTVQVYVAEVDGVTLVVSVNYETDTVSPDDLAGIEKVIASLRVDM